MTDLLKTKILEIDVTYLVDIMDFFFFSLNQSNLLIILIKLPYLCFLRFLSSFSSLIELSGVLLEIVILDMNLENSSIVGFCISLSLSLRVDS